MCYEPINADEISEDRMNSLRKRAELDSKYLLTFVQNDASELKESLNRHIFFLILFNLKFSLNDSSSVINNTISSSKYYADWGAHLLN